MSIPARTARLGKGLAALMGEMRAEPTVDRGAAAEVPLDLLEPNPHQPRMRMDEAALQELAESIKARGILQPILARPLPGTPPGTPLGATARFQIVAGERRWRAAALAGLATVPVYVRGLDDTEAAAAALVENLQRQDLNAIEEAEGFKRLIDEFGFTHEAMGDAIGKSRPHISGMLRLLNLPAQVQDSVRQGKIAFAHARAMLRHPAPEKILDRVVKRELSVRQIEDLIVRELRARPPKGKIAANSDMVALENELTEALGLRARIVASTQGRGRVSIEFSDWDQLEAIRARLSGRG